MADSQKKEDGWGSWALIVFLFAIGLYPVALVLLFMKLFGGDEKKKQTAPPLRADIPYRPDTAAAPGRAKTAAKKVTKSPVAKKSNAKTLKVIGLILLAFGAMGMMDPVQSLLMGLDARLWLAELMQFISFALAGGGMVLAGTSMERSLRRYPKYLSVLGDREAMDIGQIARTLGYSKRRVEKDLQKMIDKGYFGGKAYLNVELGFLFRSGKADADLRRERAAANTPPTPRETEEGYSGILRDIRRANDAIADPGLSAKIDRLEEIAARIFKVVEDNPIKQGRIDTFLNYYLPTTQKLLDSYAEFEAAGVEGENLRLAKSRIEATMDAIVQGFEHQLDELYKGDALDVDSDIRVMETMLRRDTASVERDFGLGHAAANATDVDLGGSAAQRMEESE